MSDEKRIAIISHSPGCKKPFSETPVMEKKPFHRKIDQRTMDVWVYADNDLTPGAPVNVACGKMLGYPDPTQFLDTHVHKADEVVILLSMREGDDNSLGCKVDFTIDGELHTFTDSTVVFVPAGVPHGPLIYRDWDGSPPYNYIMHCLLDPVYG
jgi:hypothetical protein